MMLYRAVTALLPGVQLTIEHSISHGYYCRLEGYDKVSGELVAGLKDYLHDLVERDLPFERHEDLTAEVCAIFEQQGLISKARLLRTIRELYPQRHSCHGRNQYVLDFSRKEVVDCIYEMMYKILSEAKVSYIKWDMNRSITECYSAALPADRSEERRVGKEC